MKRPPLGKAEHHGELPLSLEQEELWRTWPLPPDSIAYNHPLVLLVDGEFDRGAWDRAVATLVVRHDALRTRFAPTSSGELGQIVGDPFIPEFSWHDLSTMDEDARDVRWEQLVGNEIERPFDLAAGELVRGIGARLEEELHGVLLVFHRAAVDCWASGVLERELVALYESPMTELREPVVQYPDYTLWQRGWWNGPERERLLEHWRAELLGWQPLKLPADRPAPETFDTAGDIVQWWLNPAASAALEDLARQERTSPFVILCAAYAALLGEWTGQSDVLVATTLGGRTLSSLSTAVGLYANTVLLRSDLDNAPTFRSLLAATRRRVITAFSYQQAPFGQVVADLAPTRDRQVPALTGALLSHQEFVDPSTLMPRPPGPIRAGYRDYQGAMREARRRAARSTLYDLELHTIVNGGMVTGLFDYRSQRFEHSTIEDLSKTFEELLERFVTDPDAPIRR